MRVVPSVSTDPAVSFTSSDFGGLGQLNTFECLCEILGGDMNFEDLEGWKKARVLTNNIYSSSAKGFFNNDYALQKQIRRAAVSIMSNISEGYERSGNKELIQFLSIAKGSCGEVRSQLYVAIDQKYLERDKGEILIDDFRKLSIMIHNFIDYLKQSPYKGHKFKK